MMEIHLKTGDVYTLEVAPENIEVEEVAKSTVVYDTTLSDIKEEQEIATFDSNAVTAIIDPSKVNRRSTV